MIVTGSIKPVPYSNISAGPFVSPQFLSKAIKLAFKTDGELIVGPNYGIENFQPQSSVNPIVRSNSAYTALSLMYLIRYNEASASYKQYLLSWRLSHKMLSDGLR